MLRLDNSSQKEPSLWESVLPPELFQMNEELAQVDKLFGDEMRDAGSFSLGQSHNKA